MFGRTSHRTRRSMGGGGEKATLRDALRNRGGAPAAALVTPAQSEAEDEPEKSGLDWLNLTAFAPKNLQSVIEKLRADHLPTVLRRGESDAEDGPHKATSGRPASRPDHFSSESEEGGLDPSAAPPAFRVMSQGVPGAAAAGKQKAKSGIRAALQARGGMQRAPAAPAPTGAPAPELQVSVPSTGLSPGRPASPSAQSPLASSPLPSVEEDLEAEAADLDVVGTGVLLEPQGGLPASAEEPRDTPPRGPEDEEEEPAVSAEAPATEAEAEEAEEAEEEREEEVAPATSAEVAAAAAAEEAEEEAVSSHVPETVAGAETAFDTPAAEEQEEAVVKGSADDQEAESPPPSASLEPSASAEPSTPAPQEEPAPAAAAEEQAPAPAGTGPEEEAPMEAQSEEPAALSEAACASTEEVSAKEPASSLAEDPELPREASAEVLESSPTEEPTPAQEAVLPPPAEEPVLAPEVPEPSPAEEPAPAQEAPEPSPAEEPTPAQEAAAEERQPAPEARSPSPEPQAPAPQASPPAQQAAAAPQPPPGTKIVEVARPEASKKMPDRAQTDPWKLQHFNKPLPKLPADAERPLPWKASAKAAVNRRHTLGNVSEDETPKPEVKDIKSLKEVKEFWGKNAKGFAGPAIGSKSRLSKCEAQATMQRLIATGGAVDFDEVRRLRKMIAELD